MPLGSGLSSSAALEVAVLRGLRDLFGLALDDVRLAQLGQRAENDFVGAPVGVMDQMAASLADDRTALFLDTRTLRYEQVPLPDGGALVVINSGVAHNHASGDYRTRRAECERAAAALGVPQLRDLGPADLPRVAALPEPLDRRARHVVTEDERVLESVAAMKAGDLRRLGELFTASHASQRDDFEVSVPEIDLLVDLAQRRAWRVRRTPHGRRVRRIDRRPRRSRCQRRYRRTRRARLSRSARATRPRFSSRTQLPVCKERRSPGRRPLSRSAPCPRAVIAPDTAQRYSAPGHASWNHAGCGMAEPPA